VGDMVLRVLTGPIQIRPGEAGRLIVLVPYSPERVAKIKTCLPPRSAGRGRQAVAGRRWHHKEQDWTVPHTDGALAHLLALFAEEPVAVDPSLRPVRAPDTRKPLPEPEILQDPTLLDRVREALRSRHYSRQTEQAYCHWVKRFIVFHGVRHPADMAELEVNAFLPHLAIKARVSAST